MRSKGGKDERDNSRPLQRLCAYRNILLLLGFWRDRAGLVDYDLSRVIVGGVASRAELLMDACLADTLLNDLLERAAGIG